METIASKVSMEFDVESDIPVETEEDVREIEVKKEEK